MVSPRGGPRFATRDFCVDRYLVTNRKVLITNAYVMGLSTQRRQCADSQVDLTKLYKTLTFGANRANDERGTAI